jgi:cell division protease FtsH
MSGMSDETAKLIDAEIKDFIDRNYQRAEQILKDNMDILHTMKDALMKYETIDALQIDDLMERRDVRPPRDAHDIKPEKKAESAKVTEIKPEPKAEKPAEEQSNDTSSNSELDDKS